MVTTALVRSLVTLRSLIDQAAAASASPPTNFTEPLPVVKELNPVSNKEWVQHFALSLDNNSSQQAQRQRMLAH